ncbi:hypothetical protein HpHA55_20200 [Helicobacter pylori]
MNEEMKPFDIILEVRIMLSERFKMLFSFLFLNVGCLSVNFIEHVNKPHLWFCGLYDLKRKQEYYKSVKSLKFDSVSELEKDLNMEVTNDEWENIKKLNEKLKMFSNVCFLCFFINELSHCGDARYSLL